MQAIKSRDVGNEEVKGKLSKVRKECALLPTASIALNISQIPDDKIKLIFATLSGAGLKAWQPDILGTPTSLYNVVHEAICIETFQQAVLTCAYRYVSKFPRTSHLLIDICSHMGVAAGFKHMEDRLVLTKVYQSYIFARLKTIVTKEQRAPGSLKKETEWNKISKRRKNVSFILSQLTWH